MMGRFKEAESAFVRVVDTFPATDSGVARAKEMHAVLLSQRASAFYVDAKYVVW